MIIHALRQPDGPAKERLLAVLGKGDAVQPEALADGLEALAELGSVEYARTMAEDFHRQTHASWTDLMITQPSGASKLRISNLLVSTEDDDGIAHAHGSVFTRALPPGLSRSLSMVQLIEVSRFKRCPDGLAGWSVARDGKANLTENKDGSNLKSPGCVPPAARSRGAPRRDWMALSLEASNTCASRLKRPFPVRRDVFGRSACRLRNLLSEQTAFVRGVWDSPRGSRGAQERLPSFCQPQSA